MARWDAAVVGCGVYDDGMFPAMVVDVGLLSVPSVGHLHQRKPPEDVKRAVI